MQPNPVVDEADEDLEDYEEEKVDPIISKARQFKVRTNNLI